jgi:hypothetical protein
MISSAFSSRRASPSENPISRSRPGKKRAVDLERGILGRGTDEGDQPALDIRQERVLLRLVEAMHLVDEEDGMAPAARELRLRRLYRLADVLYSRKHRRQRDELGIEGPRHETRERRLADAGRAPEDHRVRPLRLEGEAQRLSRAEQVLLPDHLVQCVRTQTLGEWRVRLRRPEEVVHLRAGRARPCRVAA